MVTLRPLLRQSSDLADGESSQSADLRVYKEQLEEVDRDVSRGLLTGDEAKAARIEVSRRLLAADEADTERSEVGSARSVGVVFYAVSGFVVLSSLGFYLAYGSPGYSNRPHAVRASIPAKKAGVGELIARVEARLRTKPDDGQGWDVLAPVYLKQGRNRDAVRAYQKSIELLGENAKRLQGLSEAILAATNGAVVPAARKALRKLLALQPNLIAPRFWLAVAKEQDGDKKAAADAYRALLKPPEGKPPLPPQLQQLINERLAAVSGGAGSSVNQDAGKGPSPPPEMVQGMSAEQRNQMINQMVTGLAERLNNGGGTEQEWQRLIRAYAVLGRKQEAVSALKKAKLQFAKDAEALGRLDAFAKTLGVAAE